LLLQRGELGEISPQREAPEIAHACGFYFIFPELVTSQEVVEALHERLFGIKNGRCTASDHLLRGYHQAVQKLSEDLYSAEFHFIFELLQNADDPGFARRIF
jgi:hypothetical protein